MMGFVTEKREEIMSLLQYAEWQLSRDVPDFETRMKIVFEISRDFTTLAASSGSTLEMK